MYCYNIPIGTLLCLHCSVISLWQRHHNSRYCIHWGVTVIFLWWLMHLHSILLKLIIGLFWFVFIGVSWSGSSPLEGPPDSLSGAVRDLLPSFPAETAFSHQHPVALDNDGPISPVLQRMVMNQTCERYRGCAPFPLDAFQQVNKDYRSYALQGFVEAQEGLGGRSWAITPAVWSCEALRNKPSRATPCMVTWRTQTPHTHTQTHTRKPTHTPARVLGNKLWHSTPKGPRNSHPRVDRATAQ